MKRMFFTFLVLILCGKANAGELIAVGGTKSSNKVSGEITSWAIVNCPQSEQRCLRLKTSKIKVDIVINNFLKDNHIDPAQLGINLVNIQNMNLTCSIQLTPEGDAICANNKISILGGE